MTARITKAPSAKTIQRRLRAENLVPVRVDDVTGWVPAAFAERIRQQIEAHQSTVDGLSSLPPAPRGRPPKA